MPCAIVLTNTDSLRCIEEENVIFLVIVAQTKKKLCASSFHNAHSWMMVVVFDFDSQSPTMGAGPLSISPPLDMLLPLSRPRWRYRYVGGGSISLTVPNADENVPESEETSNSLPIRVEPWTWLQSYVFSMSHKAIFVLHLLDHVILIQHSRSILP